ncbi:phage tail protein [Enterococcus sulfureus]
MITTFQETFTPMEISKVGFKFHKDGELVQFGCAGTISAETEMASKTVKCGVQVIKKKNRPVQVNVTLTGHAKKEAIARIMGLTNEGLKPGVYSYDDDSSSGDFTVTADIIDDFDEVTKLIAFPKCTAETGLQFTVDKTADEYAMIDYTFTSMFTEIGGKLRAYVEAFTEDIDEDLANQWRTNFTTDLVEKESV